MAAYWHTHNNSSNTLMSGRHDVHHADRCVFSSYTNLVIDQSIGRIKLLTRWWQREGSGSIKFTGIDPEWSVNVCMTFHGEPNVAIFHHKCRPPDGRRENQRTSTASSSGNNGCLDQIVPISLRYFTWLLLDLTFWWRYMTCQGSTKVSGLNSPRTIDVCTKFQTIHLLAVEIFNIWWANQQTTTAIFEATPMAENEKKPMRTTVVIRMTLALRQIPSSVFQLSYPLIFRWYPAECNMDSRDGWWYKTETCLVSLWSRCMVKSFLLRLYGLTLTRDFNRICLSAVLFWWLYSLRSIWLPSLLNWIVNTEDINDLIIPTITMGRE